MRIIYLDFDSLRPDHLGCYGYHRDTSPNIDKLAAAGVRFDNVYASDAPCMPSRTALWSGRHGIHTGVVNHGGEAAYPFGDGKERNFIDSFGMTNWMMAMRMAGYRTATISPFGERHSAWHWYAGFNDMTNTGKFGFESADEITPIAQDWLKKNAENENWFLHVNYWDPHTPYRVPEEYGNPFEDEPIAPWFTEEVRQKGWEGCGPHSTQEPLGWGDEDYSSFPRMPAQIDSMEAAKQWIDGYDTGIKYADDFVGDLLNTLEELGILDDTVIVIGADHGENQGELNVWGDHQLADNITCRVPLIIRWPGLTDKARIDQALHYHFDWAATLIELVGGNVPENWDGKPFTDAFKKGKEEGRPYLVTSQQAWSCQRAVRFDDYICIRTYHDGYRDLDPMMLFNVKKDPHEQKNLAEKKPQIVNQAMAYLSDWYEEMAKTATHNVDPMLTVIKEGGPFHTRGMLASYTKHLKETGRESMAALLLERHPGELGDKPPFGFGGGSSADREEADPEGSPQAETQPALNIDQLSSQTIMEEMAKNLNVAEAGDLQAVIQYSLSEDDGGDWIITINDGACTCENGVSPAPDLTITATAQDYKNILAGKLKPMQAVMAGRIKFKGNNKLAQRLPALFTNHQS